MHTHANTFIYTFLRTNSDQELILVSLEKCHSFLGEGTSWQEKRKPAVHKQSWTLVRAQLFHTAVQSCPLICLAYVSRPLEDA